MNNLSWRNILLTLMILVAQVIILNRLNISQALLPMVYPLVILSLQRNINKSLLLLVAFTLGLLMDIFSNTGGAHAVACTVLAFLRPLFLASLGPTDMGSEGIKPSILNLGLKNYTTYSIFLLAIHHIVFFILESFSFSNFFWLILRLLVSFTVSWILVMIYQFTFESKK